MLAATSLICGLVFGVWCLVFGVWCLVSVVWSVGFGVNGSDVGLQDAEYAVHDRI